MQSDLDTKGTYEGHDSEHGIQFERGGKPFTLYRTNGDDIGIKYLTGKTECLKVQDGEGYCRELGSDEGGTEWMSSRRTTRTSTRSRSRSWRSLCHQHLKGLMEGKRG